MIYYLFGEVLQELRAREDMTQEELAFNICSVSSVSKIERGIQMPSAFIANALLSKFGVKGDFFAGFGTAEELELAQSWDLILSRAYNSDGREGDFERQLYEYVKILDKRRDFIREEEILKELLSCLSISVGVDDIYMRNKKRLYTYVELHLMNSIAVCSYKIGRIIEADNLLEMLYEYMRSQYVDSQVKRHLFPVVVNNLAVVKNAVGQKNYALMFCREGVSECVLGHMKPLPFLYGNWSAILESCGKSALANEANKKKKFFQDLLAENSCPSEVMDKMEEPYLYIERQ